VDQLQERLGLVDEMITRRVYVERTQADSSETPTEAKP
jgi:hypothetical protein